ncbi:MAG: hypothetical protein KHX35_09535 [Sutterella wadsworthensis]|nr:hypothetical protein [Sutterella wadsworthensis]
MPFPKDTLLEVVVIVLIPFLSNCKALSLPNKNKESFRDPEETVVVPKILIFVAAKEVVDKIKPHISAEMHVAWLFL